MTRRVFRLSLLLACLAVLVGQALAVGCEEWNTEEFFEGVALEIVEGCLAAGAEVNAWNGGGHTPLHVAAGHSDNPAIITLLLDAGAEVNNRGAFDYTPLHVAAGHSDNPAVLFALLEAGADVNARDKFDQTPLHWAIESSKAPDIITALLDGGADANAREYRGYTPLHMAAGRSDNPAIITLLLDAGADASARDSYDKIPWDYIKDREELKDTEVYRRLRSEEFDLEASLALDSPGQSHPKDPTLEIDDSGVVMDVDEGGELRCWQGVVNLDDQEWPIVRAEVWLWPDPNGETLLSKGGLVGLAIGRAKIESHERVVRVDSFVPEGTGSKVIFYWPSSDRHSITGDQVEPHNVLRQLSYRKDDGYYAEIIEIPAFDNLIERLLLQTESVHFRLESNEGRHYKGKLTPEHLAPLRNFHQQCVCNDYRSRSHLWRPRPWCSNPNLLPDPSRPTW